MMRTMIAAIAAVLLLGATAQAGWYVGPVGGYAYYPAAPVYVAPAPVYVAPPPYAVYRPRVVVPAPVYAPYGPAVVGPRGRVYVPGRPVRNAVRVALPY